MTVYNQKKGIAVSIVDKAGLRGMERADEQNCGPIMDGTEISVFPSCRKLCTFKTYDSKYFSPSTSPKLFTLVLSNGGGNTHSIPSLEYCSTSDEFKVLSHLKTILLSIPFMLMGTLSQYSFYTTRN